MPGNAIAPPVALLCEVDARAWSGVQVFHRGADTVALPTFDTAAGEGLYEDLVSFLCGRGSQPDHELAFDMGEEWTGAGSPTLGIDEDDRFFIDPESGAIIVEPSADNAVFGFDTAGQNSSAGTPRLTANSDWQRGNIQNAQLTITTAGGSFTFPSNSYPYRAQDLVTLIRKRGAMADTDDVADTLCLEHLDNTAVEAGRKTRWGVDEQGHVWTAWRTGSTVEPTWDDDDFRDLLGFSGNEAVQSDGLLDYMVAEYPSPLALVPSRPLRRCRRVVEEQTRALQLLGGSYATNELAVFKGWDIRLWVDGPVGSDRDLEAHLVAFLEQCRIGSRLSLYRHWGDPRRHLPAALVRGNQAAYDLLHTAEHRRGRLRCLRHHRDAARRTVDFDGDLDMRHDFRLLLADNPED